MNKKILYSIGLAERAIEAYDVLKRYEEKIKGKPHSTGRAYLKATGVKPIYSKLFYADQILKEEVHKNVIPFPKKFLK